MVQYIDKNALVVEIVKKVFELLIDEDRVKSLLPKINNEAPKIYEGFMSNLSDLYKFANNEYKDKIVNVVLDNIALDNLIEVKDVDLKKEIKEEYLKRRCYGGRDNMFVILNEPQFNEVAEYFFELGLKVQKGE